MFSQKVKKLYNVDKKIVILISVMFSNMLVACTQQSEPLNTPETIIETIVTTVIIEPTVEIHIQANKEDVAKFTRELLDKTSNCQASDFLYDFTSDGIISGYRAGIKNVRDNCELDNFDIEIPENCKPCQTVIPLVHQHAELMLEGTNLIEKGNAILDQNLLSDGLEKFWDADELFQGVAEAIDDIRIAYNLPELTRE